MNEQMAMHAAVIAYVPYYSTFSPCYLTGTLIITRDFRLSVPALRLNMY